jgi:hypothetical protein
VTAPPMTPEQAFLAGQWSAGVAAGQADARGGTVRDVSAWPARKAAGYQRGLQWGLTHRAAASLVSAGGAR